MRSAFNDFLSGPRDGLCELITVLALYAIELSCHDKRRCFDRAEISHAKMGLRPPHFGDLLVENWPMIRVGGDAFVEISEGCEIFLPRGVRTYGVVQSVYVITSAECN